MSFDSRTTVQKIAAAAWEKKARDLRAINVRELLQVTDYFVICSGTSDRHVAAIAEFIERELRKEGVRPLSVEGKRWGRWVCMDYADVVVHVFYRDVRALYDLESLWEDAPELELEEPEWIRAEVDDSF